MNLVSFSLDWENYRLTFHSEIRYWEPRKNKNKQTNKQKYKRKHEIINKKLNKFVPIGATRASGLKFSWVFQLYSSPSFPQEQSSNSEQNLYPGNQTQPHSLCPPIPYAALRKRKTFKLYFIKKQWFSTRRARAFDVLIHFFAVHWLACNNVVCHLLMCSTRREQQPTVSAVSSSFSCPARRAS